MGAEKCKKKKKNNWWNVWHFWMPTNPDHMEDCK